MNNQSWDITCTKEIFEKAKLDERFPGLLTLARFVNALRFCQTPALFTKQSSNTIAARSSINSFLFISSVLYEGFILIEKLSKYYKNLDSFKNGFGTLMRDKTVTSLKNNVLKRARNKFVFHFDNDTAKEALESFDVPKIRFASGVGTKTGEIYFGLSDELAINYLLQPQEEDTDESLKQRYIKILEEITTIMNKFSKSAEMLMADVLNDMGFVIEEI